MIEMLLSYGWFMARVLGLSLLIIGVIAWLNRRRFNPPKDCE